MTVHGTVDRPLGSVHPTHPNIVYPINYGYLKNIFAGDGEEQDAYILGAQEPLKTFTGVVIAIYHRINDNEDKWVVALDDKNYSNQEILDCIYFQEQYFQGKLYR